MGPRDGRPDVVLSGTRGKVAMASIGPYRLLQRLGTCQVGQVWWGADAAENYASLAILDAAVASDERWRQSFVGGAYALAPPRGNTIQIAAADFAASAPWVACTADAGPGAAQIFVSLGLPYQPDPLGTAVSEPAMEPLAAPGALAEPVTVPVHQPATLYPGDAPDQVHAPVDAVTQVHAPTEAEPELPADGQPPGGWAPSIPPRRPAVRIPDEATVPSDPPGVTAPRSPTPVGNPWAEVPAQVHSAGPAVDVPVGAGRGPGPAPVSGGPGAFSGGPGAFSGGPGAFSGGPGAFSNASRPVSGAAGPVSGPPRPVPLESADPFDDDPGWPGAAPPSSRYPPIGNPIRPRRRRAPLLIGVAVLVLALLAGAGAGYYFFLADSDGKPTTKPTASESPAASTEPLASASQPGVEPPKAGDWPASWPTFGAAEPSRTMTNLPGLAFTFKVPESWDCAEVTRSSSAAAYTCQPPVDGGDAVGGEVIVRTCPDPCNSDRRVKMRRAEEAWGLQWVRAGNYAAWAETSKVNGSARYGLVVVAYWRSAADGAIDRQLVIRMTAPPGKADDLRKVANSIRDAIR